MQQNHIFQIYSNADPDTDPQAVLAESEAGLSSKFRSEKIPRNRLGTVFVIPRNSVFIERVNFVVRNRTERNGIPRK